MELKRMESGRVGDCYFLLRHASGLDIYLYPKANVSTTRVILGTKYGSIDNCFWPEDAAEPITVPEGIAHYLEHKLFESEDGDAFARFSQTGASPNAYTGFDSTCYVFSCTDQLYESLEILLDFVQAPYFTDETIAKERGIIAQEISMYDDQPNWQVFFRYLRAMYHVHPVREDVAGTLESIARITPDHLYRCYNTFYNLRNMVLVLAGRFQAEKVTAICDKMLKPAQPLKFQRFFPQEPPEVKVPLVEQRLPVAIPVFQFGYKDDGNRRQNEADLAATAVLLEVLASDASPMFRRLMDQGLANDSSFSYQYFEGPGFATATFSGESRDPQTVAAIIQDEIGRLQREGISEKAFRRAQRSLYGDCVASLNSPSSIAGWVLDFALRGLELFTYIDALAELSREEVSEKLAIFREDRSVLSIIRPL